MAFQRDSQRVIIPEITSPHVSQPETPIPGGDDRNEGLCLLHSNRKASTMIEFVLMFSLSAPAIDLGQLTLPDDHQITIAARATNVRQMALGSDGTLFAGSRKEGKVYAFQDRDNDGRYEQRTLIASGLTMPSGVAIKDNDLYVAAVDKIWRYRNITPLKSPLPQAELLFDQLPDNRHHGWKYLKFGPDQLLYFNIGAPCNICLSPAPFATIARLNPNSTLELIAQGVRNSVGFDWHPETRHLWFTDNGRDHLGDDQPSDELNRLTAPGQHFGYPFIHAADIPDPDFSVSSMDKYQPPAYNLGAHVAPLGMTFYTGNTLPRADQNTLFIAEHGSWNRSKKVGYRVVKLRIAQGKVVSHQPFISGWLQGEEHWGRPNDLIVDRDGSLLISDDYAGVIYRVSKKQGP